VLRQPSQTLTSERLVADLSSEQAITHAEAEGGIVLDASVSAAGDAPVDPAAGGTRHLEAKRLVMEFAQGRMKSAMAGPDATMTVQPGPKETREVRRVQGRFLAFTFDGEGRLTELQAQKDAGFRLEPIPPAKGEVRQLTTQNFTAKVDPLSGELRNVEFGRNAEFVQGTRKATAQQGNWNAERQVLELRRNPQVTDGDGSLLDAQVIDMNVATGDITAEGRVRHDVKPRPAANAQAPFSGASGGFANSKSFVYDAKTKTARYSGDAKLQSGTDIVSAQTIVLGETPEGRRTLTADTGVQASLVPRQGASPAPGAKPPEKLVASSDKMRYDEAKRELVFEGHAKLQQGVLVTESPTANAALDDTGGVRQLVAGEPVKVTQDKRTATGTKATYTPAQDTMVITGDKVVLDDPGQQKVEGRSITFHMKSDRIVVDGQERRRTEMRLKGAPIPGVGTGGKAPTVPGAKAPAPGGAKPPAAAPAPKASAAPPARP
jgi:lipopolysaccharide transport protein LptA